MDAIIEQQTPQDLDAIEDLLDRAFGKGRHAKAAYRFRDNTPPVEGLSLVARRDGRLVGTIRFWPAVIEGTDGQRLNALLLGPIAVEPDLKGIGIGRALMRAGLEKARESGHRLVILVGDFEYYSRLGFKRVPLGALRFPGWVDETRILYMNLAPGAFGNRSGRLMPVDKAWD